LNLRDIRLRGKQKPSKNSVSKTLLFDTLFHSINLIKSQQKIRIAAAYLSDWLSIENQIKEGYRAIL
jgi:hypothetical protein